MSDEFEPLHQLGHTVSGGGIGAVLVGGFMRWLYGRDAAAKEEKAAAASQAAREEFVLLRSDVQHMMRDLNEYKKHFEDVVEFKLMVKALHGRVDDLSKRIDRVERLDIHIK